MIFMATPARSHVSSSLSYIVTASMAATAPVQNKPDFSEALKSMREFTHRTSFEDYATGVKICRDKEGIQPIADALQRNLSELLRWVRIVFYILSGRPKKTTNR
jgi:hypothetical protein